MQKEQIENKSTKLNKEQYNIKYSLITGDTIPVETTIEGWFTEYIYIPIKKVFIPIKKVFSPKKYILKNIKKHCFLEDVFRKLDETEILEVKERIENIAIESYEEYSHKENKEDIENLKIKKS